MSEVMTLDGFGYYGDVPAGSSPGLLMDDDIEFSDIPAGSSPALLMDDDIEFGIFGIDNPFGMTDDDVKTIGMTVGIGALIAGVLVFNGRRVTSPAVLGTLAASAAIGVARVTIFESL